VSGATVTVSSASVRVGRMSGSDPLIVRLEKGDGTLIEQGQIAATSFPLASPAAYVWGALNFSSAHTLQAGQTYHLVVEAAPSSRYEAFPIRKGTAYNFKNTTFYPDGYAQFNPNGTWVGWTQWGVTNRTDGDLQYYFRVAASTSAPTISNVGAGSLTSGAANISWNTDQTATSQVEYGATTSYAYTTNVDGSMVTTHAEKLSSLTASTLYHYRVLSTNSTGQQSVSGDMTFTTSVASGGPVISNVSGTPISTSSAVIAWTTDEHSTSQVQYGLTTNYGSWSAQNSTLMSSHSQTLSGLTPGTVYHFRVISINGAGEQSVSGDYTFRTHLNTGQ
ncbi:MAG: fibronectin type III domain-containing protein, partial [Terracidiphilus sp.]